MINGNNENIITDIRDDKNFRRKVDYDSKKPILVCFNGRAYRPKVVIEGLLSLIKTKKGQVFYEEILKIRTPTGQLFSKSSDDIYNHELIKGVYIEKERYKSANTNYIIEICLAILEQFGCKEELKILFADKKHPDKVDIKSLEPIIWGESGKEYAWDLYDSEYDNNVLHTLSIFSNKLPGISLINRELIAIDYEDGEIIDIYLKDDHAGELRFSKSLKQKHYITYNSLVEGKRFKVRGGLLYPNITNYLVILDFKEKIKNIKATDKLSKLSPEETDIVSKNKKVWHMIDLKDYGVRQTINIDSGWSRWNGGENIVVVDVTKEPWTKILGHINGATQVHGVADMVRHNHVHNDCKTPISILEKGKKLCPKCKCEVSDTILWSNLGSCPIKPGDNIGMAIVDIEKEPILLIDYDYEKRKIIIKPPQNAEEEVARKVINNEDLGNHINILTETDEETKETSEETTDTEKQLNEEKEIVGESREEPQIVTEHVDRSLKISDKVEESSDNNDIFNITRRILKDSPEEHINRTVQVIKNDFPNIISVASITAKKKADIEAAKEITEIDLYKYLSDTLLYKERFMLPIEHVINECLCWKIGMILRQIPADLGPPGKGKTKKRLKMSKIISELDYKDVHIEKDWDNSSYLIGGYNIGSGHWESQDVLDKMAYSWQNNKFVIVNLDDWDRSDPEGYFAVFMTYYDTEIRLFPLKGYGTINADKEYTGQIPIPPPKFIFTATANGPRYGNGIELSPRILDRIICIEPYLEYDESKLETLLADKNDVQIPDLKIPFNKYVIDYILDEKDFSDFKIKMSNIKLLLKDIDKLLKNYGIEKSYRTYDVIILYLYLAYKINSSEFSIYVALDFIIKQKYLPKIRGVKIAKKTLEDLKNFLMKQDKPYIFTRTIDKIDRMINNGYEYTDYF